MKQGTILIRFTVGLMFVVVAAYLVLSWIKTYTDPYKLVFVYNDVIESSVTIDGWIFRDEVVLESAANGLKDYNVDEGEKVAKGQTVVTVYQSEDALTRQLRIENLEEQLSQLLYAQDEDSPDGINLEEQLVSTITTLQSASSRGDYSQLYTQTDLYKKLVLRREFKHNDGEQDINFAATSVSTELSQQRNYLGVGGQAITATEAGTFSSHVDGYETLLKPEDLMEVSVLDFQALVRQSPSSSTRGAAGKVATSSLWYFAMVIDEEQANLFRQYNQVNVRFSTLVDTVPMSISEIGYSEDGQMVVLLTSRRNMGETIALRQQTCTIIFRSEEGIRIPQKALREQDGNYGVYTVTGYRAEFKPVRVLAEDNDYYIVEANTRNDRDKRVLRSGDEVIVTTAELFEGKVVR